MQQKFFTTQKYVVMFTKLTTKGRKIKNRH